MTGALVAAGLAWAAVMVALPAPSSRLRGLMHSDFASSQISRWQWLKPWAWKPLAGCVAGLAAWISTGSVVIGAVCGVLVVGWLLTRERGRNRRYEDAARAATRLLADALAAEITAGAPAPRAVARAIRDLEPYDDIDPETAHRLRSIAGTAEQGGDVARAMRDASTCPGARPLNWLAACWEVGERNGAGLSAALERLADGVRTDEALRREVRAQLSAPRATARLLGLLPVLGLLIGQGIGASPVHVLLYTTYGMVCLVVGLALNAAGLLWTEKLARTAEEGV
jgi:tight adherence protein B